MPVAASACLIPAVLVALPSVCVRVRPCSRQQACIRRLHTDVRQFADRLMTDFLTLPNGPLSSRSASVIEGVIMGIGAVAGCTPRPRAALFRPFPDCAILMSAIAVLPA